jgi:N-acetylglucosamine malate deacetylase 1
MRVVSVMAHQDDELQCLGTLLRMRERGDSVALVCTSSGNKGLPFSSTDTAAAAAVRDAEIPSVAAELDADYRCLGREDGMVREDEELRRELIAVLRELGAELVFTHWTSDYNSDHVETARAVVNAALWTNLESFEPHVPALAHVPAIFHTNPGAGYGFEPTHFVELDERLAAEKARIGRLHASQMAVMAQLGGRDYVDQTDDKDRVQGERLLVQRAESFRPCLAERRIPWPTVLPGPIAGPIRGTMGGPR